MKQRVWVSGIILVLVVLGIGGGITILNNQQEDLPPNNPIELEFDYPINETLLTEFSLNIQSGGVPPDGIPPIDNPVYIEVDEADQFLEDHDIVFGFIHEGEIFAFPQKILVWHEIVNDIIGGENISITYCPLTG
ncbi:MAG: DUF3179 domain-containing (seleno)protein, partial [Candidatus Thorarchaeota archaeon]